MQIKNFEDFEIWQEARHLIREIYTLSKTPKFSKDLGLRTKCNVPPFQSCRTSRKDLSVVEIKSLSNSSTSRRVHAVRSQLYGALDQEYVDQKVADNLPMILKRLSVMIKHLIDHLKRSGMRGPKYGNSNPSSPSETS